MKATNEWKLGLFVVLVVGLGLGAAGWIGAAHFERETRDAVTYLDESVQGLDVGSPVKIRGVTIGQVSGIGFAPDHMRVEITMRIFVDGMTDLGFDDFGQRLDGRPFVPANLRIRLATAGITGLKFLEVDFVDEASAPVPELAFDPPWAYVPAEPSKLKSLEERGMELLDALPGVVAAAEGLLRRVERTLDALDVRSLQARTEGILEHAEGVLRELETELSSMDLAGTTTRVDALLDDLRQVVDVWGDAEEGPLGVASRSLTRLSTDAREALEAASLGSTMKTVRETGESITTTSDQFARTGEQLEESLQTLEVTLETIQALAAKLERDPGILLRGSGSGDRP